MQPTPHPPVAHPRAGGVLGALLEFEQAPGRYPVARREPALLFDQLGTVLRLASNRAVDGGTASAPRARQAARFFVRTVMLRPGADHYTLLGLTPAATPEQLREHYRMMIRLVHPDFVHAEEAWPADAAARINIAHDVLSSPERRQRYDATLAPPRAQPQPAPVVPPLGAAAAGAGWALCWAAACSAWRAASRTSCLRMRPPTPDPVTVARSTPCWAASLRTSGVT